jgi:hypothetical protein
MSIFGKIKDAIFGKAKAKPAPAPQPTQTAQRPAQPQAQQQQPSAMPQMAPAAQQPVDVDEVLADLAADKGGDLNYKSSIVDLMKLLDLDSSLANRKELAEELGYTGARDGRREGLTIRRGLPYMNVATSRKLTVYRRFAAPLSYVSHSLALNACRLSARET